ncbi:MAG: hypothetical protein V7K67_34440 [Nostoc sp.]|uniref:hypothetical protein n=1 Tax=Nostoc sp. TaxID=1180 RepID=UPI002FF6E6A1
MATILGLRDAINRRIYKCFVAHSELYWLLDCLVSSLRLEMPVVGAAASLTGGRAARSRISRLWLKTRFEEAFSLS